MSPPSEEDENSFPSTSRGGSLDKIIDPNNRDPLTGSLLESEKIKLYSLVDRWEEPDRNLSGSVSFAG
jgi:hypothetical protein